MLQAILPKEKQNQITLALLLGLFALMLLLNLFQVGEGSFVAAFNNLVMLIFITYAAVNSFIYWRTVDNHREARQVWRLLGAGLALYALGSLVWAGYKITGAVVPYPSLGDACWVTAYILLCAAIYNRYRLLGARPPRQWITVILASGAVLAVLIFGYILAPIYRDPTPGRAMETGLNTYYLLMDLLLVVLCNFLGATMVKARLSLPWNLIATGALILSITDMVSFYGLWNGLYYPASGINPFTRWVDLGYGLAGCMVAVGVFMYRVMVEIAPEQIQFEFTRRVTAEPLTYRILPYDGDVQPLFQNLYFMVDPDHQVFFFSDNFRQLSRLLDCPAPMWGRPLHEVIGIGEAVADALFADLSHNTVFAQPADLKLGRWLIPVIIQAHTVRGGTDIFIRYRLEAGEVTALEQTPIETLLINEVVRSVRGLEHASTEMKESTAFFVIEVQELYTFLVRMNGFRIGQILADKFNQTAAFLGADVSIQDGRVVLNSVISTDLMAQLLGLSIQTVRSLTTVEATQGMIRQLNQKIPENITRSAQQAGLAL